MGYAKIIKHLFLEYYISIYKKRCIVIIDTIHQKNMG